MTTRKRYSVEQLARHLELAFRGDGAVELDGVGTLSNAGGSDLAFLANKGYRSQLPATAAGAVLLSPEDADDCPVPCLVAPDPYLAFARAARLFDHRPAAAPGIHPNATIDPTAVLGRDVSVGPSAVVGANSIIGDGCTLAAGCVVSPGVVIGAGCSIGPNVTLMDGVRLGARVIVHAGAVLGADGFGIAFARDHWEKVPQLGGVVVGDDCEIGANSTIDRGAIEDTVLEDDVRIDNLVQVAHNVRIGAHTAIAACTGISGSTRIGQYVLIAGQSGIAGHLEIADRVTISAKSAVMKSITEPGSTWGATVAARPIRAWQRSLAHLNRLDRLVERVRTLENKRRKSKDHE